jgi:phosphatidylinositol alpha-1,6-mannosyltransferase
VPDETLPQWLASSDLMVMDCRSRWAGYEQEGFGIVFAEAAACGVAQIAGRSGGSHEAVLDGETGLIVDPRSDQALVTALDDLLGDPARRAALGARAREHAVAHLDWRALASMLSRGLAPFDGYPI